MNSNWSYSPETPKVGQIRWLFKLCDLEIRRRILKNNRAPLLSNIKLYVSFHQHMWIETGVTVRKRLNWVVTSVTLTLTFCMDLTLVLGDNSRKLHDDTMMGQTDGRTDGRTENTIHRAAWSLLKNNWSRTENVIERTWFSKSMSNDLADIGQGQRSSHATDLFMLVIICTKYGKNPSRTVDATEQTGFSRSRPNDLENINQGQSSLHVTHPLMIRMICAKYGKNASRIVDFFSRWKPKNYKN